MSDSYKITYIGCEGFPNSKMLCCSIIAYAMLDYPAGTWSIENSKLDKEMVRRRYGGIVVLPGTNQKSYVTIKCKLSVKHSVTRKTNSSAVLEEYQKCVPGDQWCEEEMTEKELHLRMEMEGVYVDKDENELDMNVDLTKE